MDKSSAVTTATTVEVKGRVQDCTAKIVEGLRFVDKTLAVAENAAKGFLQDVIC